MKIEFLALETTGLDPKMDEILEWCVASFDTGSGKIKGDSGILLPQKATCGQAVVELHTKSGLFEAMGQQTPRPFPEPAPCNGRIVWAKDFACGFLPLDSPWQHAADGSDLLRIARMLGKAPQWDPVSRARDKVEMMCRVFAQLNK